MTRDIEKIFEHLKFLSNHRQVREGDPVVVQAIAPANHGYSSRLIEQILSERRNVLLIQEALHGPILTYPTEGDLVLCLAFDGGIVREVTDILSRPIEIIGETGCGKSYLVSYLGVQHAYRFPTATRIFFDLKKSELYENLHPWFERTGNSLQRITNDQLRINPLEAIGDPRTYTTTIADSLGRALQLPLPSIRLLAQNIGRLYWQYDVLNGSQRFPIMHELRNSIAADVKSNKYEREAILNRLDSLLVSNGNMFVCRHSERFWA